MKTLPLVQVTWSDAMGQAGWIRPEDAAELEPVVVHTVGWLVFKSKKKVVLVGSHNDAGDYGDPTVIPTDWVLKIRRLKRR